MSVDFRCENCGKMLSLEGAAGGSVKCPHCGKNADVPAGLAGLPRPHVPSGAPRPAAPAGAPAMAAAAPAARPQSQPAAAAPAAAAGTRVADHHDQMMMGTMAAFMPWVISLFFHLGLILICLFATMMARAMTKQDPAAEMIIPDSELLGEPGGSMNANKTNGSGDNSPSQSFNRVEQASHASLVTDGRTTGRAAISVAGGTGPSAGGSAAQLGLGRGGTGPGGPGIGGKGGGGGNVYHLVFVIDRSGSMKDTFDTLREKMTDSFMKLKPPQDFAVIFFSSGDPVLFPKDITSLQPANMEIIIQATDFLNTVQPQNQTNPVPAMKKAFDFLDKADTSNNKRGKMIYFLTDAGVIDDQDALMKLINERNAKHEVVIKTFLYNCDKDDDPAVAPLRKIASENGGKDVERVNME